MTTSDLFELNWYRIRRKVLKIMGASFHVYDRSERVVAFSSQKAFKLKEDIRLYSDESKDTELLTVHARQIIDFSAGYDVLDSQAGTKVGAARRKGFKSILRDQWEILDANDKPIAKLQEDSGGMAFLRRFLSNLIPQKFVLTDTNGAEQATFAQRFNPFVYKLEVSVSQSATLDRRLIMAAAVLLAAIEGRQS
jgi:hypothetical protein